ncbi:MAG: CHRD domain-containing protein [Gaiellaceae bacterium]
MLFAGLGGVLLLGLGSFALADGGSKKASGKLIGYQEVPSVSSRGSGEFEAKIVDNSTIEYKLSYRDLEAPVQQGHIHFGQRSVNGGISVFLCSNLGNGPAGTQACPASPATISGTIVAANVIGPAVQGIAAGEFAELLAAIRAGKTYANVHTSMFPGGEIRAQLGKNRGEKGDREKDDD